MIDSYIDLKNLSLDYFQHSKIHNFKKTLLKSVYNFATKKKEKPIHLKRALTNISIQIENGDRVALIGKNGSGKSTLLRVLSGIYHPTGGTIKIQGSISSLLDISVGLNLDATGYENIVLMGILLGKTKGFMRSKIPDIEKFTELKDYLKIPVKTYSTGMRLRLAFGIITSIESDILIIDEVIGVGDQLFLEKAQSRLKKLINKSHILVLTSHSPHILHNFCNKALVLKEGECVFFGNLQKGLDFYENEIHI